MRTDQLTVGEWRKVLAALPDDTPILLKMENEMPDNLVVEFDALCVTAGGDPILGPLLSRTHVSLIFSVIDTEDEENEEEDPNPEDS